MRRVVLSAHARADLLDIGAWIGERAPLRAFTFVAELRSKIDDLAVTAERFTHHPNVAPPVRRRAHGNFVILYEVIDDTVLVHAVVRGSRDLARLSRRRRPE